MPTKLITFDAEARLNKRRTIAYYTMFIALGLAVASAFAALMALGEHHIAITGQITSLFLVGASLGSMTVPWLIGQFFESCGEVAMVLWELIAVTAAAVALSAFLWAVKRDK